MAKVTLANLADLSIGTPEIGAVNFNALHTLLHAMLKKMKLSDACINFDGENDTDSICMPLSVDIKNSIINNMPLGGQVASQKGPTLTESEIQKGTTDNESQKNTAPSSQTFSKGSFKDSRFSIQTPLKQLEEKVQFLDGQLELLNRPQTASELLKLTGLDTLYKADSDQQLSPIQEIWQNIKLAKRVAANEEGIERLNGYFAEMMMMFNNIEVKISEITDKLNSDLENFNGVLKRLEDMEHQSLKLGSLISATQPEHASLISWEALEASLRGDVDDLVKAQHELFVSKTSVQDAAGIGSDRRVTGTESLSSEKGKKSSKLSKAGSASYDSADNTSQSQRQDSRMKRKSIKERLGIVFVDSDSDEEPDRRQRPSSKRTGHKTRDTSKERDASKGRKDHGKRSKSSTEAEYSKEKRTGSPDSVISDKETTSLDKVDSDSKEREYDSEHEDKGSEVYTDEEKEKDETESKEVTEKTSGQDEEYVDRQAKFKQDMREREERHRRDLYEKEARSQRYLSEKEERRKRFLREKREREKRFLDEKQLREDQTMSDSEMTKSSLFTELSSDKVGIGKKMEKRYVDPEDDMDSLDISYSGSLVEVPSDDLLQTLYSLGRVRGVLRKLKQRVKALEDAEVPTGPASEPAMITKVEQLQNEVEGLKERQAKLLAALGDDPSTFFRELALLKDAVNAHRSESHEQLESLREEILNLASVTSELIKDGKEITQTILALDTATEKLKNSKADKDLVAEQIDVKADKRELEDKVTYDMFMSSVQKLNDTISDLLQKLALQEEDWREMLKQLNTDMNIKLNREELASLKAWLESRLRALNNKIVKAAAVDDEAAGIRKQLISKFNCISCDRPIEITPSGPVASIPFQGGLPPTKSPRPYTTFELDQIRQHAKSMIAPSDYLDTYITDRSCGGSYTVMYPNKRATKSALSNLFREDGSGIVKPVYKDEAEIMGTDGRIYHGRGQTEDGKLVKLPTVSKSLSNVRPKSAPGNSDDQSSLFLPHPPHSQSSPNFITPRETISVDNA